MKKSIQQTILPIKLEISQERLTSFSGLVLLKEYMECRKIAEQTDQHVPGPGSNRGYNPSEFIEPLILMLHAGGRQLEDLRELKAEPELLEQLGIDIIPDAGTVGDWLRRQGIGTGIEGIEKINNKEASRYFKKEEGEVILDVDASGIEAEKQAAQYTYQKYQGYMPMIGYASQIIVGYEFREGNESPSKEILEFSQKCEQVIGEDKYIYLRSDSAGYQAKVINHWSQSQRKYTITADMDTAVKNAIKDIAETEWKPFYDRDGVKTDREIAETVHTMNETEEAFRLIVLRWQNQQRNLFVPNEYRYYAIASNRTEIDSEVMKKHQGRGESENWHKELKIGFGMEQMPCGEFEANAMFFAIGVLAYNLAILMKQEILPETYRSMKIETIRWKLYRLAGKLVKRGRRWILRIKTEVEKLAIFTQSRLRCAALAHG